MMNWVERTSNRRWPGLRCKPGRGSGREGRGGGVRARYAAGPVLLTLLMALAIHARTSEASSSGPAARLMGRARIDPQLGSSIPLNLTFRDASGDAVELGSVCGARPVILHLVYFECPMLCKLSADGLLEGLERLDLNVGEEFDVITLSFDPREGPELAARARRMALERYGRTSAADGWHFLTGDAANIGRLTESVGFHAVWDEATAQYAHPSGIFVLTADGMISRYLSGIQFRPRDLRLAVVEASAGRLGSVSDQLLMLCYQYDPTTGRYGLAIMSAMRASGAVTVFVLVSAIVVMVRRERRKSRTVGDGDDTPAQHTA